MKKQMMLAVLTGLVLECSATAPAAEGSTKPNIIVIIADDQGYADVGFHGCRDIPTPNLDSIGRNGVVFTDGYATDAMCSPSRAGFVTGRYQQRFGYYINPGPAQVTDEQRFGLPVKEITIADLLKTAGYATGLVGKWHLGSQPEFHPQSRGFDEFFGFMHGVRSYSAHAPGSKALVHNSIFRGRNTYEESKVDYLTRDFTNEAVDFIERYRDEPFFLCLSYNAVHGPIQAPPEDVERFAHIPDEGRRTYAAMVHIMDEGIGQVLKKLREHDLEENTLVVFFNDNGGSSAHPSSNMPLYGSKGMVHEGGVRVPFVLQWPRRVPAGMVFKHPVMSFDILPTAVAAAGGTLPDDHAIDGVDLLPYLTGEKTSPPHEFLFWKRGPKAAVRWGNWKLIVQAERSYLFDLHQDIGEKRDCSDEHPRIKEHLGEMLADWEKGLAPRMWDDELIAELKAKYMPEKPPER